MRIGRLNKRIELQRISSDAAADRYGQKTEPWEAYATVWASVSPISGRELTQARQRQSSATHTIKIRNRSDTTAKNRAVMDSRVMNFESVIRPEERGDELVITAIEQTTGATGGYE